MPLPILQTARLTLRPPIEADLDRWAAFAADAQAMRFLGGPVARPVAWRSMATIAGSWMLRGFSMFSVIERSSGTWIGRVGPLQPEGWPGPEIGWGLAREAWGHGYALEAAIATIEWSLVTLRWTDITHNIDPDNVPSIALARKLGAVNRGPTRLPPPYEDNEVDCWGQTAAQWASGAVTQS